MKKIIIIALLQTFPFFWGGAGSELYAQSPKADSIQKLLSKYDNENEKYLHLLNALSLTQVNTKPDDALATVDKAIALAQKLNNQQELAAAYNNKGFIVMRKSNFGEAISFLKKSLTINTDLKNKNGMADNYCNLGALLMYQGGNDSAKKYFFDAISIYEKTQNKNGLADANYYLAGVYGFLNYRNEQKLCLEKALPLYQETGNENGMAASMSTLGIIEIGRHDVKKAFEWLHRSKQLNEKNKNLFGQGQDYLNMGILFSSMYNNLQAIENYLKALRINDSIGWQPDQVAALVNIGICYGSGLKQYQKGLDYDRKALELVKQLNNQTYLAPIYFKMAENYSNLKEYNRAFEYFNLSLNLSIQQKDSFAMSTCITNFARTYDRAGNYDLAIPMFQKVIALDKIIDPEVGVTYDMFYLSNSLLNASNATLIKAGFKPAEKNALSVKYLQGGIDLGKRIGDLELERDGFLQLSSFYEKQADLSMSLKFYKNYVGLRDSIINIENAKYIANVQMQYDSEKKEQQIELLNKDKVIQQKEINKQKTTRNAFIAGFILVLLLIGLTLNRYRVKQKANRQLSISLEQLKQTQTQLIQSEKMASLGELTAGIAHEIQNPLNFVNNFSEVNKELVDELQSELRSGNTAEAIAISNDIKDNEEKINHHGKRADAIVKGMLQHSRSSNGIKERTDINALCDEYLRLSYHGLRAKDKSFNATLKTDFDYSIEKINIIPQDIGRVILNLLNNAFYAVNAKALSAVATPTAAEYQPTVSISTKKINGKIEINVSDNGNGIPAAVKEKIFQPFFTTKPTGQGTGLGLSLSYDIITKGHRGELKSETKEGEGTTFIIQLPIV